MNMFLRTISFGPAASPGGVTRGLDHRPSTPPSPAPAPSTAPIPVDDSFSLSLDGVLRYFFPRGVLPPNDHGSLQRATLDGKGMAPPTSAGEAPVVRRAFTGIAGGIQSAGPLIGLP